MATESPIRCAREWQKVLGARYMQVGMVASAFGGRQLRFVALLSALALINVWTWIRVLSGPRSGAAEIVIAALAGTAALLGLIALWRNPLHTMIVSVDTPAVRYALATHHAGHIVAAFREHPERLRRVDLHGPCTTHHLARTAPTQSAMRSELVVTMSGLSAEEVFTGESGTYTATDLAHATRLGADYVGRYGMSGSLVSLAATRTRRSRFIGRVLGDPRTRKELESLLRDVKRDSMRIMLENRHIIITLRDSLLRHGELSPGEIRRLADSAAELRHRDDEVLVDLRSVAERNRPLLDIKEI